MRTRCAEIIGVDWDAAALGAKEHIAAFQKDERYFHDCDVEEAGENFVW